MLLLQELKKIWRPGILAVLVLLGAMYYYTFPSFYIKYFCNGPTAQAEFDLTAGWVEKYGPTMDASERAELDGQREAEITVFNGLITQIPEAVEAGLTDYDAFMAFRETYYESVKEPGHENESSERLIWRIIGGTNYYTVHALESFMEHYDAALEAPISQRDWFSSLFSQTEQARILELEASPQGFIPAYSVETSTAEYGKDLAVWIVLSVVLLLSPTLVRDRLRRMRQTQWASRRGRRILNVQFAAAVLSATVLTLLNLIIYGIPFIAKGPLIFRSCPLYTCNAGGYPWFDWTYGQYLAVLVLLLLALGLAAGALTVFLSQYSGNYVAMLLKAIPLFVVTGTLFGSWLLDRPFYFKQLYENAEFNIPRGTETVCITVLLALSLMLLFWSCRQQKKRELSV